MTTNGPRGRGVVAVTLLCCLAISAPSAPALDKDVPFVLDASSSDSCTMSCSDTGSCCCKPAERTDPADSGDAEPSASASRPACPESCAVLGPTVTKSSAKWTLVAVPTAAVRTARVARWSIEHSVATGSNGTQVHSRAPPSPLDHRLDV